MVKDEYIRETVVHLFEENLRKVTLAAEGNTDHFKVGDEVRLAQNNGRFCLLDENEHMIPAEICANVPLEEALTLSLAKTAFSISKVKGNVFKAEMKNQYSLNHNENTEWCWLN